MYVSSEAIFEDSAHQTTETDKKPIWDATKADAFADNISDKHIAELMFEINKIYTTKSHHSIDEISKKVTDILLNSASITFPK